MEVNIQVPKAQISVAGHKTLDLRPIDRSIGKELRVRIPYKPRAVFVPYHNRVQRFSVIVAHRRCGKTVAEVNEGIRKVLRTQRVFPPPQACFISPVFAQGKRNAWPYVKWYTAGIPGCKTHESDLTITFPNGGKYILAGSDNFDSLRGTYWDHASLDEYAQQDPAVWTEVIRPALSDYKGSATFIGSPAGRNHFYTLLKKAKKYPETWYVDLLKASQTGLVDPDELLQAQRDMTPEAYAQEYECSFDSAVKGTYYGKEIEKAEKEGRIRNSILYDRSSKVYASWDLGIGDNSALWIFQVIGNEIRFLRYLQDYGEPLQFYVDWCKELPFKIDEHFLPHDGAARELQTGKSRQEYLEEQGRWDVTIVPKHAIEDGINACRVMMNRMFWDNAECEIGIDCIRMYQAKWKEKEGVMTLKPFHNWASHGADALRTGMMGLEEIRATLVVPKTQGLEEGWMQ